VWARSSAVAHQRRSAARTAGGGTAHPRDRPRPGPHSSERIVVHRTRRLDPADVTSIDGIRVTTIARTTLDLAEQLNPRQRTTLIDQAEALGIFDLTELEATIAPRSREDPPRETFATI
jgi:hypothetical protein